MIKTAAWTILGNMDIMKARWNILGKIDRQCDDMSLFWNYPCSAFALSMFSTFRATAALFAELLSCRSSLYCLYFLLGL